MATVEEERRRYLEMATTFFNVANRELNSGLQSKPVVAHLIWQGTELSLKALSVGHSIPVDHNLDNVTSHLLNNSLLTDLDLSYLKPLFVHVTGSHRYDDARYPEKDPSYWENMTADQLAEGLNSGLAVRDFIKEKLMIRF